MKLTILIYYRLKKFIPRTIQIRLRRVMTIQKRKRFSSVWPIDENACSKPKHWPGWPEGKQFALVLTHDVDTPGGQSKCRDLMLTEMELGFRSSFNFVPRRYEVCHKLRNELVENGFEVGVHGLYHDGKLYSSFETFMGRAISINKFLRQWGSVGFRSPAMHHNLDWLHHLDIEYDCSTFDTDPFEPQPEGVCTIFPFWVEINGLGSAYVELPYTLPQDFTLFILLKENTINIWQEKLDWVAKHGGMVLVNTHPDYMSFNGARPGREEYPVELYRDLLVYIKTRYSNQYWHALPREITRFWLETIVSQQSQCCNSESQALSLGR